MSKPDTKRLAYLQLALAMVIVGSSVVVGKMMLSRFPIFLGNSMRFSVGILVMLPLVVGKAREAKLSRSDWTILFLQALTGIFIFNLFLLYGLRYTTAAESGIITSTSPAVLAVLSFLFLKDQLTRKKIAAMLFALLGILSLQLSENPLDSGRGSHQALGNLLVFGAVVAESLFSIFGKAVASRVSPMRMTFLMNVLGFCLFLPFAVPEAVAFDFGSLGFYDWLVIGYSGSVVTVFSFLLWFNGLQSVSASTAAVFTSVWPVSTLAFSYGLLGEKFLPSHLIGVACVVAAIVLISKETKA